MMKRKQGGNYRMKLSEWLWFSGLIMGIPFVALSSVGYDVSGSIILFVSLILIIISIIFQFIIEPKENKKRRKSK